MLTSEPNDVRARFAECVALRDRAVAEYQRLIVAANQERDVTKKRALAVGADIASCLAKRAKAWADNYGVLLLDEERAP